MKNWKRIAGILLLLLMLVPLWLMGSRISRRCESNRYREENFSPFMSSPYMKGIPMDEMNFQSIGVYMGGLAIPMVGVEYDFSLSFELPDDLRYYRSTTDKVPAVVLPEGTQVVFWCEDYREIRGYGLLSYPTYEKGWRYVRPFVSGNEKLTKELAETQEYYYVRLEQLVEATDAAMEQSGLHNYQRQQSFKKLKWYDLKSAVLGRVLQVDMALWSGGGYFSPDLYLPLWDTTNTLLLCSAAVLGGGGAALLLFPRKKKPKTVNSPAV